MTVLVVCLVLSVPISLLIWAVDRKRSGRPVKATSVFLVSVAAVAVLALVLTRDIRVLDWALWAIAAWGFGLMLRALVNRRQAK